MSWRFVILPPSINVMTCFAYRVTVTSCTGETAALAHSPPWTPAAPKDALSPAPQGQKCQECSRRKVSLLKMKRGKPCG